MAENKMEDSMSLFNIEVPSGVISDSRQNPGNERQSRPGERVPYQRKSGSKAERKVQQKTVHQAGQTPERRYLGGQMNHEPVMKVGSALDEETDLSEILTSFGSLDEGDSSGEVSLEPITDADRVQRKSSREMQRRTTKKKGPALRLATAEARIAEQARKAARETMPVTELKLPYISNKNAVARDLNDGMRAVRQNKKLTRVMSLIIPTHSDGMMEIIRKGIVIICIVVMIFSMGILIRSTMLEKKASKENAGDYFVTKYVYSYDIYKNDNSGKEQ